MIDVEVSLYLISQETMARLQKQVSFLTLPRAGEFVQLRNRQMGDYFAFTVQQVTHREDDIPSVWLYLATEVEGKPVVDFIDRDELQDYIDSYLQEGWQLMSSVPNRTVRSDGTAVWSNRNEPQS